MYHGSRLGDGGKGLKDDLPVHFFLHFFVVVANIVSWTNPNVQLFSWTPPYSKLHRVIGVIILLAQIANIVY